MSLTRPAQKRTKYYQGAPLLAIEVVSESNTAAYIEKKIQAYLAHGGIEVWVVYPETRSVWLFRIGSAIRYDAILKTDLLPSFSLDLRSLFQSI